MLQPAGATKDNFLLGVAGLPVDGLAGAGVVGEGVYVEGFTGVVLVAVAVGVWTKALVVPLRTYPWQVPAYHLNAVAPLTLQQNPLGVASAAGWRP